MDLTLRPIYCDFQDHGDYRETLWVGWGDDMHEVNEFYMLGFSVLFLL